MVKCTQTICPLLPTNCVNVFYHFVELVLKGQQILTFQKFQVGHITYSSLVTAKVLQEVDRLVTTQEFYTFLPYSQCFC